MASSCTTNYSFKALELDPRASSLVLGGVNRRRLQRRGVGGLRTDQLLQVERGPRTTMPLGADEQVLGDGGGGGRRGGEVERGRRAAR